MSDRTTNAAPAAGPVALTGAILAAGVVGVCLVAVHGTQMFVALVESGMAWCF